MLKSLYSGASGMYAQQQNLDNISNNLANVNTTAFKKSSLEFQDLMYQTLRAAGTQTGANTQTPTELQLGSGVRVVASNKNFEQGAVVASGNPLDVAIVGEGFFRIRNEDGTEAYTRDGHFKLSAEGTIVTSDGYIVEPEISIPEDTQAVLIGDNGVVSVLLHGDPTPQEVGQFELAKFINPGGLKHIGNNMYETTVASGEALTGTPQETGYGKLTQSYIEKSNVNITTELVEMIQTQRAFDLNSKAIKASDEMLNTANGLKR